MKHILLILLMVSILLISINANAAEPPAIIFIVSFPPDDLTLSVEYHDGTEIVIVKLQKTIKYKETQFQLFRYDIKAQDNLTIIVESNEKNYTLPISAKYLSSYNNVITLDFKNQTISDGQSTFRSILLVSMRVGFTLILEGLILFLFGYKNKSSWILFLILNLITQGLLNIGLHNLGLNSYSLFLSLIFYEFIIYIVETIICVILLKEHSKARAVIFSLTANTTSYILGGLLITFLPV